MTAEFHSGFCWPRLLLVHRAEERRQLLDQFRTHVEDRRGARAAGELVKAGRVEIAVHGADVGRHVSDAEHTIDEQLRATRVDTVRNGPDGRDLTGEDDVTDHDQLGSSRQCLLDSICDGVQ
jgi:hypothetical protein